MKFCRKSLIIIMLGVLCFAPAGSVKLNAMDPVTIAILAPVAIKAAEVMMPYVLQGLKNAGIHLVKMGLDLAGILKLPLGVIQSTLGAPVGMFQDGLRNMVDGVLAPLQLVWHTLTFPFAIFGYAT
ncbi:MAG: hypothetical protein IKA87_05340 [Lentisphaeria bacterium]|nr:hypothetical protein [Lentisphaeria bacterium]